MGIPIIGDIIGAVKDLASEVIVDKDKKNEINIRLKELEDQADERFHKELVGQLEINKEEAKHASIFVAGWRPAIGWIGAAGLGYNFVMAPFVEAIARWQGYVGAMPTPNSTELLTLVLSMLGVGAMRSYDKVKGTAPLPKGSGE